MAVPAVLAIYFTLLVTANGVPALRHDWAWPDFYQPLAWAASGWSAAGIGEPNAFVNNYAAQSLLALLGVIFPPLVTLMVFVFAIALGVLLAARSLALRVSGSELVADAVAAVALLNPWVYTEIVAGHLPMVLAYAATMALAAEILKREPRAERSALAVALTIAQMQFFVPALVGAIVLLVRNRLWLPLAAWFVAGSATIVGVIFGAREFASTPLTQAWEQTQSVAPRSALLLTGYFAKYTIGFDKLGVVPETLVVAVALIGLAFGWRRRSVLAAAIVTVVALLVAMGLHGPAAPLIGPIFALVPAAGLYRELYDVIGFAAIGYVVLCASAGARNPVPVALLGIAALLFLLCWTRFTPTSQWANRDRLPHVALDPRPLTRFALTPPFQPLRYDDRFGGLDPDAYVRENAFTPLNGPVPLWPEDSALATYAQTGDAAALAALSVSAIANRPWYAAASNELAEQLAIRPVTAPLPARLVADVRPLPEVSLVGIPQSSDVANHPGDGAVFFGDVAGISGAGVPRAWANYVKPRAVNAPGTYVKAADGWVDARLGFAALPAIGQAFGGALTTNGRALLQVAGGDRLLVYVRGALLGTNGELLTNSTNGYRWISVRREVSAVRCDGLCVVALEGTPPAGVADRTGRAAFTALPA
ncbi:MAG: hypothetical protein JO219_09645, partial [Candidatus Eremiobacteraeota bacterium]|nr:hypothetical protein [Candidatus Eremiobacteraeota bacterium]